MPLWEGADDATQLIIIEQEVGEQSEDFAIAFKPAVKEKDPINNHIADPVFFFWWGGGKLCV